MAAPILHTAVVVAELVFATALLIALTCLYVWSIKATLVKWEWMRKIERWQKRHPRVS